MYQIDTINIVKSICSAITLLSLIGYLINLFTPVECNFKFIIAILDLFVDLFFFVEVRK